MKLIIGLVGEKGSGKDTCAALFQKSLSGFSVGRCRSSEILRHTLDLWNLPATRSNLQDIAIIMDQKFGAGTLTQALKAKMLAMPEDIIIFDAVRWQSDADMIRSFPKNALVYITAPLETRYMMTKSRKEKVGESSSTLDQFKREEEAATELDISAIGAAADFVIKNTGSIEDLSLAAAHFCQDNIKRLLQSN